MRGVQSYLRSLEKKPKYPKYQGHHWADYIELVCLANIDGRVSSDDIIDRLMMREKDLYESAEEDIAEIEKYDAVHGQATERAKIADEWEKHLADYFQLLGYRCALYELDYPFVIDGKEIVRKSSEITDGQLLYIYLLLCSNLNLLDESNRVHFANYFELVCFDALKRVLPTTSNFILFGANPLNRGKYSSKKSLWQKVHELAEELNETVSVHFERSSYPENNRGDDGLDLVAAVHTGDSQPSSLIILGQCACTTDWKIKQGDSAHDAWINKISFVNTTANLIFIPFCFRAANGNWFKKSDIRKSLLIDRKRLLYYLAPLNNRIFKGDCFKLVRKIVTTRESVV